MTFTLVGIGISAVLAIFGWYFKWKLNQDAKDKATATAKTLEAKEDNAMLASEYQKEADRENRIIKIIDNPSDADASELLSRRATTPKAPGTTAT